MVRIALIVVLAASGAVRGEIDMTGAGEMALEAAARDAEVDRAAKAAVEAKLAAQKAAMDAEAKAAAEKLAAMRGEGEAPGRLAPQGESRESLEKKRAAVADRMAEVQKEHAEVLKRSDMGGGRDPKLIELLRDLEKESKTLQASLEKIDATLSKRPRPRAVAVNVAGAMTEKEFAEAISNGEVVELVFHTNRGIAMPRLEELAVKSQANLVSVTSHRPSGGEVEIHVVARTSEGRQLQTLREDLRARGFLPVGPAIVWSEAGEEKARKEARKFAAAVASDFVTMFKAQGPDMSVDRDAGAKAPVVAQVSFRIGDGTHVTVRVTEITPEKAWVVQGEVPPAAVAHFKKLGLMAALHYKPSPADLEKAANAKSNGQPEVEPEHLAISKAAFTDALTPLLKRERETEIKSGGW